ncbi:MAG: ASCH domain-containing protein [Alphaproteobacteria bacterium]|nr:ASCH domain-containing protein [Alphaproteobacteria bacterium]
MKVLLSIKPQFVDKIISGEKLFEYRKAIFKNPNISTVVIYSTMPVGRIVAEFSVENILKGAPDEIWEKTKKYSGISKNFFFEYFKERNVACAIEIKKLKVYKKPIDPYKRYNNFTPPQSYLYLD